jgi:hypothetical protein
MPLRLFHDLQVFADALAGATSCAYAICNRDRLVPAEVLRLEESVRQRGHSPLDADERIRRAALTAIHEFFGEAAQSDPNWRFAYSSKVVLSIPGYQDLQNVFLVKASAAAYPDRDVLVLAPDPRLRSLFAELFCGVPVGRTSTLPSRRAWARFTRTLLRTVLNRASRFSARVLFFTLSSGVPRQSGDAYFGDLAQTLGNEAPTRTVYLASGSTVRLPADAARAPFEAFVTPLSVVCAWFRALFWAARDAKVPQHASLAALHRHMRLTEIRSGEYFMQRVLEVGFAGMLRHVRADVLVYPFENRSWEKHLLAQAQRHGVHRRVGYQHSSITPRHLAFHIADGDDASRYLPDCIVTIGAQTESLLKEWAPTLAGRITVGASLRTVRQNVPPPTSAAVLVAISSNRNEALSLLKTTHEAAALTRVSFIVRTHPTIPVEDLFALFASKPNVQLSTGRTLAEDLSRVSAVAYSSSTVALEGMLYGRLPVYVEIGDLPSGDPIIGDYRFKFGVSGGKALADTIDCVGRMDAQALAALRAEARDYAETYLRAPSTEAMRQMTHAVLG